MEDKSYVAALEAAPEPHRVVLGPAPCQRCGAWVDWAGVVWTNAGTKGTHECAPFLQLDEPEGEVVAEWVRPTTGLAPYRMAHPAPEPLPAWVHPLGQGLLWVGLLLGAAVAGAMLARAVGGGW